MQQITPYAIPGLLPKTVGGIITSTIGDNIKEDPKPIIRGSDIVEVVCEHYGILPHKLSERTRKREVVEKRQIAMYLICEYTKMSLAETASLFGDFKHSTVHHARKTITNLIDSSKVVKSNVNQLNEKIECRLFTNCK